MKLGRVTVRIEGESANQVGDVIETSLNLDDLAVIESITKKSYEDPEQPDRHYESVLEMPWDSLEPIDKAFEAEHVEITLKALLALVREKALEGIKK